MALRLPVCRNEPKRVALDLERRGLPDQIRRAGEHARRAVPLALSAPRAPRRRARNVLKGRGCADTVVDAQVLRSFPRRGVRSALIDLEAIARGVFISGSRDRSHGPQRGLAARRTPRRLEPHDIVA
jgi:hypothetical protein